MSNLPKIIQDQITQQQRKDLGQIVSPAPKVLVFPDVARETVDLTKSAQWLKRIYSLNRNNNLSIDFTSFNNTTEPISSTVIAPTNDGSLIDNSLKIYDNIEYSIDIYTKINKSYTFKISTLYPIKLFIYRRLIDRNGAYFTSLISSGNNVNLSFNFQADSWQTILIYLYNDVVNNSIAGFDGLNNVVDTWRIPDVFPPSVPEWYETPLRTETNGLTGISSNILQWVLPDNKDWAGNGVYYYINNTLNYSVSSAPYDIDFNGILVDNGSTAAFNNFSIGSKIYPNSPYSYDVSDIYLLSPNKITNPMFTNTSASNTFKMWTKSPNSSTVKADRNAFYTAGVSVTGSSKASGTLKQTAYIEYSGVVNVNSGVPHEIMLAYKHSSNAKTALVEMQYYTSDGVTPASTASQYYLLDSSMTWRTVTIPIFMHDSLNDLRKSTKSTSHSFKMPSNAVYVKPRLYFYKNTSSACKTNFDFVQISKRGGPKLLNSTNHARVALITKEYIQVPDTRFCKAHIKLNNSIDDSVRSITGTQLGTAVYRSSAYFARFATCLQMNSQTRNYIRNGHFSSSTFKGTSNWSNSNLVIFATAHTCLFGTRSLKIGASSTSQYAYQTMPATLTGSIRKKLSFYSLRGQSDGVRVLGTLSGVTSFSYSQLYHTSNWQRMMFKVATSDTIKIYPTISTPSTGNHIYLSGIQFENNTYTPYNTQHINGVNTRTRSGIYYNFDLLSSSRGTIAFWFIPQMYSNNYNNHSTHNSQNYPLISNGAGSGSFDRFSVFFNQSSARFSFTTESSISVDSNTISSTVMSYKPNDKIHIVATWDANYMELYVNGVPSASANKKRYWPDILSYTDLYFGIDSNSVSCNGYIDDIKIEQCIYGPLQVDKDYKAERLAP